MALLGSVLRHASDPDYQQHQAQQRQRDQAWTSALAEETLPDFVKERLARTKAGELPWVSTGSVGSLLAQRSHGIHPLGMVSGNCWYHFGFSWTRGHYDGWHTAISRMQHEAALMGANAVVDVRMNVKRIGDVIADQMDYGVLGTAVRIAGLAAPREPVIATVSALEFARLVEAGILPVGLAIGAEYNWCYLPRFSLGQIPYWNQEYCDLSSFMAGIRTAALGRLASDGARMGTGVLARVQFSQLLGIEPPEGSVQQQFLGRHIAFGTVVLHDPQRHIPLGLRAVFNTRDGQMTPVMPTAEEII